MVLGPPAVAAAAKHQIESQWGMVNWSRSEWPGLNLPSRPMASESAVELPPEAPVAGVSGQGASKEGLGVEDIQAGFSKIKEGMQV